MDAGITLFIGSSVINTFSLVRDDNMRIYKFKGATAKGLGQGNSNHNVIMDAISHKYVHTPIRAVVWMFGSVDCKFSFFYKLATEEMPPDPRHTMERCAESYMGMVEKVDALLRPKGTEMIVLGVEPNGTPPDRCYDQCMRYRIFADLPERKMKIEDYLALHHPDELRQVFNDCVKRLCLSRGFRFVDIDDSLLTSETTDMTQSIVRKEYVDLSPLSVHLNWEANLLHYMPKLEKWGVRMATTLNLGATRGEYLEEKRQRLMEPPRFLTGYRGVDSERRVEERPAKRQRLEPIKFVKATAD